MVALAYVVLCTEADVDMRASARPPERVKFC